LSDTSTKWRERLAEWLRRNSSQMLPDDPRRLLREEFVRRFPKERLRELTKQQYALGHPAFKESFCYWLEWKTRTLGSVSGGSVSKWGLWWDKNKADWKFNRDFRDADDALAKLINTIANLVAEVEAGHFAKFPQLDRDTDKVMGNALRAKPLYLYFPDEFVPIASEDHLRSFLDLVGLKPKGGVLTMNRQLREFFRTQQDTAEMDPQRLMDFLYDRGTNTPLPPAEIEGEPDPIIEQLMELTDRPSTRNIILYGPPGTGKTWIVNHYANYFLLHHNVSPQRADQYWQAVQQRNLVVQHALQAEIRSEGDVSPERPDAWMLIANEQQWDWKWQQLYDDGQAFFTLGSLQRNFHEIAPGDVVFGYRARPFSEVIALARVREGLHTREEAGTMQQGILIEPIGKKPLATPVKLSALAANPLLKSSEPLHTNLRGTLFKLAPEESDALADLIRAAGNNLTLDRTAPRHNYLEFVTFHQSFAYEEFVEGIKPYADSEGKIAYQVQAGVFRRIAQRAQADPTKRYLLVIDEINRANIAKVFGELITLIEDDKRIGTSNEVSVALPYSQEWFAVPANLFLLGTMNTADRSIALLDLALRRRFTFLELMPNPLLITSAAGVNLSALLQRLNKRIAVLLDRDHQIGHSYLYGVTDMAALHFAWYHRIVPLLREYFYNDGDRLRAVLGSAFVTTETPPADLFESTVNLDDLDRGEIIVKTFAAGDAAFIAALQQIAGGQTGADDDV
jgi:hypothetical protein